MAAVGASLSGATQVRKLMAEHLWTLDGFSALTDEEVNSGEFELLGNKWRINLEPMVRGSDNKLYLGLFLCNRGDEPITVEFEQQLIKPDGTIAKKQASGAREFARRGDVNEIAVFGTSCFVLRSDVLNADKGYMQNDTLRFKTVVTRREIKTLVEPSLPLVQLPRVQRLEAVSEAMNALLFNSKHR
jgi:hypothetical protein